MQTIAFRYANAVTAANLCNEVGGLYPSFARPVVTELESGAIVVLPNSLWDMPLVPELAIGLGGRMVAPPAADLRPARRCPGPT